MVSVIIPTFNEEKYIADAIKQFEKLTIKHEIIVTDDKSTDNTVAVARASQATVILVPEQKHRTIAANRNEGRRYASGEFLVFMDGDSRINDVEVFFKHCLERFEKEKRLVAITARLRVLPDLETFVDSVIYDIFNFVLGVKNNLFHKGEASGKFQMMRATSFDAVHGFREDLVSREDANMFQKLARVGSISSDNSLTVFHFGRRAHKIGWPKLLWIWMRDSFAVAFFNTSASKEWTDIR